MYVIWKVIIHGLTFRIRSKVKSQRPLVCQFYEWVSWKKYAKEDYPFWASTMPLKMIILLSIFSQVSKGSNKKKFSEIVVIRPKLWLKNPFIFARVMTHPVRKEMGKWIILLAVSRPCPTDDFAMIPKLTMQIMYNFKYLKT